MKLPEFVVERIATSVQAVMPAGLLVVRTRQQLIEFQVDGALAASAGRVSASWASQVGVRNRDGIRPQSVAWAVWMVLDSAIKMSRATGLPWPTSVARELHAYAQAEQDRAVRGWVSDGVSWRVDLPEISLEGVQLVAPSGWRLPIPLAPRYRLPRTSPVTDPGNRG